MRPETQNGKPDSAADAEILALMAMGWTLSDGRRADRLLALTGLDADALRAGVGNRAILGAVLAFLAEAIAEIDKIGVGGLILVFRLGPMPIEVAEHSIKLFMSKVAPQFQKKAA